MAASSPSAQAAAAAPPTDAGTVPQAAVSDPAGPAEQLPQWLRWPLTIAVCAVLGYALTAMPLGMLGWLHPLPAALATLVATGLLVALASPRRAVGIARVARTGAIAAGLAVALAAAVAALNAHFSSEHVVADRDPGIYLWFGRWVADHGSLLLDN